MKIFLAMMMVINAHVFAILPNHERDDLNLPSTTSPQSRMNSIRQNNQPNSDIIITPNHQTTNASNENVYHYSGNTDAGFFTRLLNLGSNQSSNNNASRLNRSQGFVVLPSMPTNNTSSMHSNNVNANSRSIYSPMNINNNGARVNSSEFITGIQSPSNLRPINMSNTRLNLSKQQQFIEALRNRNISLLNISTINVVSDSFDQFIAQISGSSAVRNPESAPVNNSNNDEITNDDYGLSNLINDMDDNQ
jgi:hypothetical protein